jgi:hypothetical protein
MAGAFGALAAKYDLSVQVAHDLIDKIGNQWRGTEIIVSGASCRNQISDLTHARNTWPNCSGKRSSSGGLRRIWAANHAEDVSVGVSVIDYARPRLSLGSHESSRCIR